MTRADREKWKTLERDTAAALGGRRIIRRWELFESRPDVVLDISGVHAVAECKLRQRFEHHRIFAEARRKYCEDGADLILVTRSRDGQTMATVPLDRFAELLRAARELHATKRERATA